MAFTALHIRFRKKTSRMLLTQRSCHDILNLQST